jgi:GAF domain-containing protein
MVQDVAGELARISAELSTDLAEAPTLEQITEHARSFVPGCDVASVTLRRRRRWRTVGATDPLGEDADRLQYSLGEGPCLDAAGDEPVLVSNRLAVEGRWPRWGPGVAELGVQSVISVRLLASGEVLGAVNLYARQESAYDTESRDLATLYAIHAANALHAAQLVSGLETALTSRHRIGVAQGILMERYSLSELQSFEVLRRYSSHTNRKLREIVDLVVDTGDLPEDPTGRLDAEPAGSGSARG